MPGDYITAGNLRLRILDRNATRLLNSNTEIKFIPSSSEGDFLHIPWMEGAKYPLSVWFFAVRELFKKPLPVGQLWTSSVFLAEEFCVCKYYCLYYYSNLYGMYVFVCLYVYD